MTGTLKIGDQKTLYRRITLHKTRPKESSSRLCQF